MTNNQVIHFIKKLKPYNIQKGLRYLKHYGFKEFCVRLSERMEPVHGMNSTVQNLKIS